MKRNEDTVAKAKTVVNQLLEGPGVGSNPRSFLWRTKKPGNAPGSHFRPYGRPSSPDWKLSKAGSRATDRLANKMNLAAARLDGQGVEPPFWIDAEFSGDLPGDIAKAKRMAADFGLKFVKADMNGNPAVHGKLKTVAEVRAFARRYGSKAVFEPGRRGGTEVIFEN